VEGIERVGNRSVVPIRQRRSEICAAPQMFGASLRRAIHWSACRRRRCGIASGKANIEIQSQEHLVEQRDIFTAARSFECIKEDGVVIHIWSIEIERITP